MRIIAGELKGRHFESPQGKTVHPMADKVRNALFNQMGDISGLTVLEPFGGSGALSFEAISRGASRAQIIERKYQTFKTIAASAFALGIDDKVKVTRASAMSWSENNSDEMFDLLLIDPPFSDMQLSTIEALVKHLKPKSLMVLCHSGREATPTVNGVVVVDNHNYGDAALSLYRLDN